jgi:hypothetical protein
MTKTHATKIPTALPPGSHSLRRCRDRELLTYVGRHGIVSMAHVMAALEVGQTAAYRRVASCIDAGLLERIDFLRGEPNLLRATHSGLRYAGLGMSLAIVSPGAVDHWLRCATIANSLGVRFGPDRILTERELAFAERHERRPIASAVIGELPNGDPRLHRPDLVVLPTGHPLVRFHEERTGPSSEAPDGNQAQRTGEGDEVSNFFERGQSDHESGSAAHPRTREQGGETSSEHERPAAEAEEMGVVAIEVELTAKSPKRLREIIRGWRRATWVGEVHYLCEPGQTRRAVERAVEKLHASDRIVIGEVPR